MHQSIISIFPIVNFHQLNLSNNAHFIYTFLFFSSKLIDLVISTGLNKNFISLFNVVNVEKFVSEIFSLSLFSILREIFINYIVYFHLSDPVYSLREVRVQKPKFMNQCIIKSLMNELVNIKLKSILRETAHLARPKGVSWIYVYTRTIHFKVGYSFRPIFSHGLSPRLCSFERRCRGATTSGQFRKHAANCSIWYLSRLGSSWETFQKFLHVHLID